MRRVRALANTSASNRRRWHRCGSGLTGGSDLRMRARASLLLLSRFRFLGRRDGAHRRVAAFGDIPDMFAGRTAVVVHQCAQRMERSNRLTAAPWAHLARVARPFLPRRHTTRILVGSRRFGAKYGPTIDADIEPVTMSQ